MRFGIIGTVEESWGAEESWESVQEDCPQLNSTSPAPLLRCAHLRDHVVIARSIACKAVSTSASVTISGGTNRSTFGPAGRATSPRYGSFDDISRSWLVSALNSIPLIKPQHFHKQIGILAAIALRPQLLTRSCILQQIFPSGFTHTQCRCTQGIAAKRAGMISRLEYITE